MVMSCIPTINKNQLHVIQTITEICLQIEYERSVNIDRTLSEFAATIRKKKCNQLRYK